MLKRWSKNGWFLGCEAYPKCKQTQNLSPDGTPAPPPALTDIPCDKCGKMFVVKNGRYGEFLACSGYPECKTSRPLPTGIACPKCGGDLVEVRSKKRGGKTFYGCSKYPQCDFKLWQKPINEPCPICNHPFLMETGGKTKRIVCGKGKECTYSRGIDEDKPAEAVSSEESESTAAETGSRKAGRGAPSVHP
jgi:DNA topoisomerase-1